MFEFFLADGTSHVKRHSRRPTVLNDVWQAAFPRLLLFQVLQCAKIGAATENGMIHALSVFEVGRVLKVTGDAVRREATRSV